MDWKWSLCDPKIIQVLPQTKAFQMRTFIENLWLTVRCFSCSNGKVNQWQKPWTEEPVSPRTTDCRRRRQINIWEEECLAILYTYSCQTLPLISVHKIPVTDCWLPSHNVRHPSASKGHRYRSPMDSTSVGDRVPPVKWQCPHLSCVFPSTC